MSTQVDLWDEALRVLREAMEFDDPRVRRQAAGVVTKYRSSGAMPSDLVSAAELIIELQEEGVDDRTGRRS